MKWWVKLKKNFLSDPDKLLQSYRVSHPLTASQKAEVEKHKPIFEKRDQVDTHKKSELWEKF